jgi:hypothetical protein
MSSLFLALVDRLGTLTVVFAAAIYSTHALLQAYTTPLLTNTTTLALTIWFLSKVAYHLDQERRIAALGSHAVAVRTWTPFNLGFIIKAVYFFLVERNLEFWAGNFDTAKRAGHAIPYTAETTTLGGRLVFTSDEENIKAILASQFADYGKGDQFRVEWKDFLGLSEYTRVGKEEMWGRGAEGEPNSPEREAIDGEERGLTCVGGIPLIFQVSSQPTAKSGTTRDNCCGRNSSKTVCRTCTNSSIMSRNCCRCWRAAPTAPRCAWTI